MCEMVECSITTTSEKIKPNQQNNSQSYHLHQKILVETEPERVVIVILMLNISLYMNAFLNVYGQWER